MSNTVAQPVQSLHANLNTMPDLPDVGPSWMIREGAR